MVLFESCIAQPFLDSSPGLKYKLVKDNYEPLDQPVLNLVSTVHNL